MYNSAPATIGRIWKPSDTVYRQVNRKLERAGTGIGRTAEGQADPERIGTISLHKAVIVTFFEITAVAGFARWTSRSAALSADERCGLGRLFQDPALTSHP
jgi:hypothetical protein